MLPAQAGVILLFYPLRSLDKVLPAQAGVILFPLGYGWPLKCAPRAGGGDPAKPLELSGLKGCSPRRRG